MIQLRVMDVERTVEFQSWFEKETLKSQLQIETRIVRIQLHGHFGDAKNLGDGLAELRLKNGRRVYFTAINNKIILLLIGGHKNAQKKEIKRARLLIGQYAQDEP